MNTISKLAALGQARLESVPAAQPLRIVALHGWGSDSSTWQPLADYLRPHHQFQAIDLPGFGKNTEQSIASLLLWKEQLSLNLPENSVLLGWSLGGMLATQIAATNSKVVALITLASNLQFAASDAWPQAMQLGQFQAFRSGFATAPDNALKRFFSLQAMSDARRREVLKFLQKNSPYKPGQQDQWQLALDLLASIDNRKIFAELSLPGLHIFGDSDSLVPLAVTESITNLNSEQAIEVMRGVGHAPHISQPKQLASLIQGFISKKVLVENNVNKGVYVKRIVAKNFSKAANIYDQFARLQNKVLQSLVQIASRYSIPPGNIADLGCGTGKALPELKKVFPGNSVVGLDLADGMLQHAKHAHSEKSLLIQGDIEKLPFKSNALSMCFSSLSVQWCRPDIFLRELHRVIMPGGLLVFSTLGPETLFELKQSWHKLDNCEHVNQFAGLQQLKATCVELGFVDPIIEERLCVLHYASVKQLMRELKGIGARNINPLRPKGLSGPRRMAQLETLYSHSYADQGKIPASYQVFYFVLRKEK